MRKHLFLFATFLLIAFAVKAQKPEIAGTMVHYKFSHLKDTTQTKPYTENMMLMIGRSATVYKSYDRWLEDAQVRKQIQEQVAAGAGAIRIHRNDAGSSTQYYRFANEKKMFMTATLVHSYVIEEPFPVINWKIHTDTASFGGQHCQKATTHFKGRDYTAWFCPDLPSQSGPWELSGLPGLILKAYDTKKQVVFNFDGMEDVSRMEIPAPLKIPQMGQPSPEGGAAMSTIAMNDLTRLKNFYNTDPRAIQLPADAIKTTEKEFTRLRLAMIKDPKAFAQAELAALGANRPGGPKMKMIIELRPEDEIEKNPIELPETKK